eukprot:7461941-Pyramimonas_sp.AAC.1
MDTIWGLRAVSRNYCARFKDMSNAFAGTTNEAMDDAVDLHCHEHNVAVCKRRYHVSVIALSLPQVISGQATSRRGDGGALSSFRYFLPPLLDPFWPGGATLWRETCARRISLHRGES